MLSIKSGLMTFEHLHLKGREILLHKCSSARGYALAVFVGPVSYALIAEL
jgi:hypothetical protein